jgi:hypothetical protein
MSTRFKYGRSQCRRKRMVAVFLQALIFLWVALGTIDSPVVNLGVDAGSVVYKTLKALDRQQGLAPALPQIGLFPEHSPPIHVSFLLFDFKQNLRRWPNVAGDIARSPPVFRR